MNSDEWLALFAEFGLTNPDAAGKRGASRAQLELALSATDYSGDPEAGVRAGHLRPETEVDCYGIERTVRYRLNLTGGAGR